MAAAPSPTVSTTASTTAPASAAPTPTPTPSATNPGVGSSPRIDASGHDVTTFASPTGAIVCVLAPGTVRCDVSDPRWLLPPKPANCRLDWGQGVEMTSGTAALTCNGDTIREAAYVGAAGTWWHAERGAEVSHPRPGTSAVAISYGATIVAGTLACTSERGGVTCVDASGGHFTVSRDTYAISAAAPTRQG